MASRLELIKFQAFDSNGDPLAGGLLYTYEVGTTTAKATYTDAAAGTPQANPIVLNSRGETDSDIYGIGYYKFVLTTSAGATIYTIPSISGVNESSLTTIGDYSGDFDAAITAIGATATTLYIDDTATMSAVVTVPATCTVIVNKGGVIDQAGNGLTFNGPLIMQGGTITNDSTLAINGMFQAGLYEAFTSTGTVTFGADSVDMVYPEWSGGIGDDSTDCSTAINNIISSGRPVYLNKGKTYLVTSAITMNQDGARLCGTGTLKGDAASFAAQTQFISVTADNCIIEDITVDQDDNPTGWSIHVSSATNTRIRRVTSTNVQQAFVVVGDTAIDTYVTDCYQKDEGYGVLVNDPTGSSGLFVRGNHFQYDGDTAGAGDGVEINAPTNGFARFDISNNYIAGYIDAVANNGLGIGVANGSRGTICSNVVEDVEHDGIHVENHSADIVISGNTVRDTGPASVTGGGQGIVAYDSSNIVISDNVVKNVNYAYGIIVNAYPDTAAQNSGNKVVGNSVHTIDRGGISLQGQTEFVVANNSVIAASQETDATYDGIAIREVSAAAQPCQYGIIESNIIKDSGNSVAQAIEIEFMTTSPNSDILLRDNVHEGTTNGINIHTSALRIKTEEFMLYETVVAASPTLKSYGVSILDSSSTAITATLPDAEGLNAIGRIKTIMMNDATNPSTVTVTSHDNVQGIPATGGTPTADGEVATFNAVDEAWILMWMGTEWTTLRATCTFV
jgi:parallel beta-helix repeat protein